MYEQVLPVGGNLVAPLGFSFAKTVYPTRKIDDTAWAKVGIPACQAAVGQGHRIGLLFFRRSNSPTWNSAASNYDMDDPTKDYLCAAYAIPAQTQANWLSGILIRDYHRRHWGLLGSDSTNRRVHHLWEATQGGAKFDVDSGNAIFKAMRAKHPLKLAASELAKTRHVGGSEGRSQVEASGWGWQGAFWVAAAPRKPLVMGGHRA